jgi:histidinol dehydrogenase
MTLELAVPAGTRIENLDDAQRARLLVRGRALDTEVMRVVARLIEDVRVRGDAALRDQAQEFDGVDDPVIEVPREHWRAALDALDSELRDALEMAAQNIAAFHRAQLPAVLEIEPRPGLKLGRRADPLERVAVYAPGGRAAYPSSVLMGLVPARVAGVREVSICSPAGHNGFPPSIVLAACEIGGADRVFAIGGAGAIAAVAHGTQTVPRADKVVGPGNAYVTEAKRQLNGLIAIDCPAGPSEVLVAADESADPERVAFELLAQAEHDPDAASVLISTSQSLIDQVTAILGGAIAQQPRCAIMQAALRTGGALLRARDTAQMLEFARAYAPEHLALFVRNPRALLADVRNAGTVFLGDASSVAFGDYLTGANHVLPTATLARAYSGLSTLDFLRWTTYQELSAETAAAFAPVTGILADAEGLPAHAAAARLRGVRS